MPELNNKEYNNPLDKQGIFFEDLQLKYALPHHYSFPFRTTLKRGNDKITNEIKHFSPDARNRLFLQTKTNGIISSIYELIPNIVDVTVLNEKVVTVTFADNTTEKAVVSGGDTFSIEQGISICIMKKLISYVWDCNGSSVYNKLVELGVAVYDKKLANEEAEKQRQIAEVEANERKWAKAQKRKAKRDAKIKAAQEAETERLIEIQKEAYLRAMREMNGTSDTAAN